MSATEKNQGDCLDPEVYIRLCRKTEKTQNGPKFKSSVYPSKKITTKQTKEVREQLKELFYRLPQENKSAK